MPTLSYSTIFAEHTNEDETKLSIFVLVVVTAMYCAANWVPRWIATAANFVLGWIAEGLEREKHIKRIQNLLRYIADNKEENKPYPDYAMPNDPYSRWGDYPLPQFVGAQKAIDEAVKVANKEIGYEPAGLDGWRRRPCQVQDLDKNKDERITRGFIFHLTLYVAHVTYRDDISRRDAVALAWNSKDPEVGDVSEMTENFVSLLEEWKRKAIGRVQQQIARGAYLSLSYLLSKLPQGMPKWCYAKRHPAFDRASLEASVQDSLDAARERGDYVDESFDLYNMPVIHAMC